MEQAAVEQDDKLQEISFGVRFSEDLGQLANPYPLIRKMTCHDPL